MASRSEILLGSRRKQGRKKASEQQEDANELPRRKKIKFKRKRKKKYQTQYETYIRIQLVWGERAVCLQVTRQELGLLSWEMVKDRWRSRPRNNCHFDCFCPKPLSTRPVKCLGAGSTPASGRLSPAGMGGTAGMPRFKPALWCSLLKCQSLRWSCADILQLVL